MAEEVEKLKTVVVGDGAVGKTSLLYVYAHNKFPERYVPTVFDNFTVNRTVDHKEVKLGLWDTAGQEEYDRLRSLSYGGTDVFIVCFSLVDRASFENVKSKWVPEVTHHVPGAPLVLVGTKKDLRTGESNERGSVTTKEGEEMMRSIRAKMYLETSAKIQEDVSKLFEEAIRLARRKRKGKRGCSIL
eukprot:TRINITY_DN656_c0_g1_i1.p1 TRINITY_DN656_c0_g1~~TRINITY_DN656_c0_g1_i1.p1  ORF type:complete len:187 (+),score=49.17 TRINITY_DN656_c0_g1_i1:92-652(+)